MIEEQPDILNRLLFDLQGEIGASLLSAWEFDPEIIEMCRYTNKWDEEPETGNADYSYIINLAQYHAYIGSPYQQLLPPIDSIPSYRKFFEGKLTPEISMKIIAKSQKEIQQTISEFS